jgi:flagellar biogenesis protein FliO
MDVDILRQGLAVGFVFALLGGAVWKLRGGQLLVGRAHAGRLATVARVALTSQHAVHLVRVDGRELVVATHPQGCTLLEPDSSRREVNA